MCPCSELSHTPSVWDAFVLRLKVYHHLGDCVGDEEEVYEAEVGQEEVHGSVQGGVRANG